jgi:hypothetical protein
MPNVKNIKPPTAKRKSGAITREEILRRNKTEDEMLVYAKKMNKPEYYLEKDTHTGETIKRRVK